jgi:hypothetical protein
LISVFAKSQIDRNWGCRLVEKGKYPAVATIEYPVYTGEASGSTFGLIEKFTAKTPDM